MWLKTSDDFPDDMYRSRVSNAAYRAHHEGLSWSNRHLLDGRLPRDEVGRFFCLGSDVPEAVAELLAKGIWIEDGEDLVIVHHLDEQMTRDQVLRRRRNDAERQSRKRDEDAKAAEKRNARRTSSRAKTSRRDSKRDTDQDSRMDDPRDLREGEGRTGLDVSEGNASVSTDVIVDTDRQSDRQESLRSVPPPREPADRPTDVWRCSGDPA